MNNSQKKNSAIYITRKEVRLIKKELLERTVLYFFLFPHNMRLLLGFQVTPDLIFS